MAEDTAADDPSLDGTVQPASGDMLAALVPDDPHVLAHPQEGYKFLRDGMRTLDTGFGVLVSHHEDVQEVLRHSETFGSGMDAVYLGNVRPLIPLQIDPPEHKKFRRLLDPLFAPQKMVDIEPRTRELVRDLIDAVADSGRCNFHDAIAEKLPTTVFLQLLGLPVERLPDFLVLKDGIIRPGGDTEHERRATLDVNAPEVYAALGEAIDDHLTRPQDDLLGGFLTAEVDGERLTREDILDIGFLFFIAGLDTVTASLDCMIAYLAQHPEQRQALVTDPSLIPHAIEEMLRWESPVTGVARVAMHDTELAGCPVAKGQNVFVMIGSANTDERFWEKADTVDFHRDSNKHNAFGGGVHRCLGSHLARMELRVVLDEWHRRVPEYTLAPEVDQLLYTPNLRHVTNLELVWPT